MNALAPDDVVEVLGDWRAGSGPLYRRLADAARNAIGRGAFPVSTKLPAERALANTLGVSRSTVVAAYAALRAEGVVASRQGSGTWVQRATGESSRAQLGSAAGDAAASPLSHLLEPSSSAIPFTMANLPALELVPDAVRATVDGPEIDEQYATHGYASHGLLLLRRAIAEHYTSQGMPTSERQVLVTSGTQQAISLVASLLLSGGDRVVLEDPSYSGAIDAFRSTGAELVSVPMGRGGLDVDRLRSVVTRASPTLLYVMPVHNPTGAVMDDHVRDQLGRLSESFGVTILEDLTLAHVTLGTPPVPSIATANDAAQVIVVESASKIFWGGLRIGWIRAAEPLIQRLGRLKARDDLGSSVLGQLVVARLLPRIGQARELVRARIAERFELLADRLTARIPSWSWQAPLGGLSLWVRLPTGSATQFAQLATQHGVIVVPGPLMSPDRHHDDCLRIPFVLDPDVIDEGVNRLAEAWEAYEGIADETPQFSVVV